MADMVYSRLPPDNVELSLLRDRGSNRDRITGVEPQEQSHIISKWGVGWRTPFLMILFYVIGTIPRLLQTSTSFHRYLPITALLIAFLHLGLFLYLNHKQSDGKDRAAPQSYVSTASNILSNAFGLSLKTSLAIASTQFLWYTLRKSHLRVSTIESLFQLRFNPFLIFDRLVITSGPILVLIAIVIWSIQIAASFPPGALTIVTSNRTSNQNMNVPTFNASFVRLCSLISKKYSDQILVWKRIWLRRRQIFL
jgi:hypothetical protein